MNTLIHGKLGTTGDQKTTLNNGNGTKYDVSMNWGKL